MQTTANGLEKRIESAGDAVKKRFSYFALQCALHTHVKRPKTAFVAIEYKGDGLYRLEFWADTAETPGRVGKVAEQDRTPPTKQIDAWSWVPHYRTQIETALNAYCVETMKKCITEEKVDLMPGEMAVDKITGKELETLFSGSRELPALGAPSPEILKKEKWCAYDLLELGRLFGYSSPESVLEKIHYANTHREAATSHC